MRLFEGMIPAIAKDVARHLVDEEVLEVEPQYMAELELDVEAVLKEYRRTEREIYHKAKDISAEKGLNVHKVKNQLARQRNFKMGDESLHYIIEQMIETFYHSNFVEEVYDDDNGIRRRVAPILRKHMDTEQELDKEVRSKIRNLEEGSKTWEIEYQKAMGKIKRVKNIE